MCCRESQPLPSGLGESSAFDFKLAVAQSALAQPDAVGIVRLLGKAGVLRDILEGYVDQVMQIPHLEVMLRACWTELVQEGADQLMLMLRCAVERVTVGEA